MAVVYTRTVVTFTLFHVSCPTASVYKRKHISAEVSKAVRYHIMSILVHIHGLNSFLRPTWFHACRLIETTQPVPVL